MLVDIKICEESRQVFDELLQGEKYSFCPVQPYEFDEKSYSDIVNRNEALIHQFYRCKLYLTDDSNLSLNTKFPSNAKECALVDKEGSDEIRKCLEFPLDKENGEEFLRLCKTYLYNLTYEQKQVVKQAIANTKAKQDTEYDRQVVWHCCQRIVPKIVEKHWVDFGEEFKNRNGQFGW